MHLRGWFRPRRRPGEPTDAPADRCELCGAGVADGRVCGLVADAAVIRPNEPALNGWRLLTACTREHLLELTARYQRAAATTAEPEAADQVAAGSHCG
jgi:hypothetical protein